MTRDSTTTTIGSGEGEHFLCDDWFDPLETGVRARIRGFIEELLEAEVDAALGRDRAEVDAALGRDRYERAPSGVADSATRIVGTRHGHRQRGLMGTKEDPASTAWGGMRARGLTARSNAGESTAPRLLRLPGRGGLAASEVLNSRHIACGSCLNASATLWRQLTQIRRQ
jgi:hypothetical protein